MYIYIYINGLIIIILVIAKIFEMTTMIIRLTMLITIIMTNDYIMTITIMMTDDTDEYNTNDYIMIITIIISAPPGGRPTGYNICIYAYYYY